MGNLSPAGDPAAVVAAIKAYTETKPVIDVGRNRPGEGNYDRVARQLDTRDTLDTKGANDAQHYTM